ILKRLFGQPEKDPTDDDYLALIVDDDQDIRITLRELFTEAGFQVSEASEGKAALAILRASLKPMVVFLDLMMPNGMGGEEAMNEIEADPRLIGRHGFILMTAAPNTLRLPFAQLLTRYNIPVLHKPFDIYEALALAQDTVRRIVK